MHVVVHNAVSVDARIDGFDPDIALYYELTDTWGVDAHLVGADTLIEGEQHAGDTSDDGSIPPAEGSWEDVRGQVEPPLLVVTDTRGRVSGWEGIRDQPFWGDVLVLCSATTPAEYLEDLDRTEISYLVAGDDHVDLEAALNAIGERGVETVLVDSGGTLNGALLRAGLVDEVSILVHPAVVGGTSARTFIRGPDPDHGATNLDLLAVERPGEHLVWLRYSVVE